MRRMRHHNARCLHVYVAADGVHACADARCVEHRVHAIVRSVLHHVGFDAEVKAFSM